MSYDSGSGSESESNEPRWVPHTFRRPPWRNVCGTHADYGIGRIDTDTDADADKP
jgi:hypothetical protein